MTALDVFFSYSHRDEALRDTLETHLTSLKREGAIRTWHDRQIGAGREWGGEIDRHLETADLILLLISPDFMASDYCIDREMKCALERHEAGEARVIPIILRPTDWQKAGFARLQALPTDGRPITRWEDRDEAFLDVVRGLRRVIGEIQKGRGGIAAVEANDRPTDASSAPTELSDDDYALLRFIANYGRAVFSKEMEGKMEWPPVKTQYHRERLSDAGILERAPLSASGFTAYGWGLSKRGRAFWMEDCQQGSALSPSMKTASNTQTD